MPAGAARIVSRRYIAEFVSRDHRTRAWAAFVGSSALGMAFGPLLARPFESFPNFHVVHLELSSITMGACALSALYSLEASSFTLCFNVNKILHGNWMNYPTPSLAVISVLTNVLRNKAGHAILSLTLKLSFLADTMAVLWAVFGVLAFLCIEDPLER